MPPAMILRTVAMVLDNFKPAITKTESVLRKKSNEHR